MSFPEQRPRRMRRTPALRALIRETELVPRHLVAPLFVKEGIAEPVADRVDAGAVPAHPRVAAQGGGRHRVAGRAAFMLFGVPAHKDAEGSEAWNPDGIAQQASAPCARSSATTTS